ncbi:MAG: fumarylacetoacetate hydrolase family protein [Flavobacteriales bacterium]|nr:fumarylacetoacetate hydrolase family protein [Flavobacteriales bacterium]MBL0034405.1 fumarylacetoacetate hydrolase family protein [Flavobacteriales bacterium]
MKIICIGRNYRDHAAELGNDAPEEPIIFLKPTTACLYPGQPIKLKPFLGDIHHEVELVVMVDSYAKDVPERMALGLVASFTLGLDLTARTLQNELKAKGLPWEKSKAFDGSAVLGEVELPMTASTDLQRLSIELKKNGALVQQGRTSDMLFTVAQQIAYVSRFITLEPGDLFFTGTPAGVGPIAEGDVLEGFLNGQRVLNVTVAKG